MILYSFFNIIRVCTFTRTHTHTLVCQCTQGFYGVLSHIINNYASSLSSSTSSPTSRPPAPSPEEREPAPEFAPAAAATGGLDRDSSRKAQTLNKRENNRSKANHQDRQDIQWLGTKSQVVVIKLMHYFNSKVGVGYYPKLARLRAKNSSSSQAWECTDKIWTSSKSNLVSRASLKRINMPQYGRKCSWVVGAECWGLCDTWFALTWAYT